MSCDIKCLGRIRIWWHCPWGWPFPIRQRR